VRNLGLIITFCLASLALPSNSFALGLGEIEVNSFLNQPLNAEIEVISARAGEIDNLLVSLASQDSFKRAGLSRPRHLSDLRFAVKKNEEGDSAVVLVTTRTAVKEPFLNFLVEADWSKGRVLREFTVLLDPPFYADTPVPVQTTSQTTISEPTTSGSVVTPIPIVEEEPTLIVQQESTSGADIIQPDPIPTTEITELSEEQISTEPIDLASDEPVELTADELIALSTEELVALYGDKSAGLSEPVDLSEPIALSEEPEDGSEIEEVQTIFADESEPVIVGDLRVEKGDTLWNLASQFMDSEHSIDQVMLAIQSMNPGAFNDNNINNMRIGAVLRAPDGEQLDRLSKRQAHVQVLEQNGLWDDYVARVTGSTPVSMAGDGSDGSSASSASDKNLTDLSLLTPGDGDSDAAGMQGIGNDANELSRQLALAEEELDASKVDNAELESRIAELEATLSKVQELQKMVEIEDDSLAQLQADQAAEAAEQEAARQAEAEQAVLDQAIEAAKQVEQESVDETLTEEEALLEKLLAEESTTDEQAGVTPPAPVIITEPVQPSDSILDGIIPPEILDVLTGVLDILPSVDSILGDPIMLGALGGIVVLLLILVLVKRRKSSEDDDDDGITVSMPDDDLFANEEELTPIHLAPGSGSGDTNINIPNAQDLEEDASDFSPTSVIPQVEVTEAVAQDSAPEEQSKEQDDTLNEVDVYLAYGLYDNAEDLLTQSLEASPERADYRSKLLDTYFATKNATKFSEQAELLKSMGSAAEAHWGRVQVMGYELAPDNPLFSEGKDSDISTADFGVEKPEAADFDLGTEEDSTNFSTTDFNLGEESDELTDTQNFVETVVREEATPEEIENTQELPDLDDLPELDDEIDTGVADSVATKESGDELDELEFAFDGEDETPEDSGDDGAMDFELPEDMDLGADESVAESEEVSMDFDMDESLDFDTDESADEIESAGETEADPQEDKVEATALIDMVDDFDATAFEFDSNDSSNALDNIDLGMDDTSLDDELLDDAAADLSLDDDEDYESTAFTSAVDEDVAGEGDGFSFDLDDAAAMDVDIDSQPAKTDTFLPGDFDDPEELLAAESDIEDIGIDDLDDLMLPDDVDEVGTKLDLARAFIDMGDAEGARSSLDEVLAEGSDEQKAEATNIIKHL
jgi:pilus assembly protein FimV